jgi:NADH-ubiquinone oxidoreductase chain 1
VTGLHWQHTVHGKPVKVRVKGAFILLSFVVLVCRYNFACFYFFQVYLWLIFLSLPLSFVSFISCLAETNRTAFDFAEGESELVSGLYTSHTTAAHTSTLQQAT